MPYRHSESRFTHLVQATHLAPFYDSSISQLKFNSESAGRMAFKPFDRAVPRLARNFRELCTRQNGFGYKGFAVHHVIPQLMAHEDDFTKGDGTGGKYSHGEKFSDENFKLRRTTPSILSMAKHNRSQFFIVTTVTSESFPDYRRVVFGEVLEGNAKIEALGSQSGNTNGITSIAE